MMELDNNKIDESYTAEELVRIPHTTGTGAVNPKALNNVGIVPLDHVLTEDTTVIVAKSRFRENWDKLFNYEYKSSTNKEEPIRAFSDTDAKNVFYRTTIFISVPLIMLLVFAGFDVHKALSKISGVKKYETRIIQGIRIGEVMTNILREQSLSYQYVMDGTDDDLVKLRQQQHQTDKRITQLYDTGFPKYLTTLQPQDYFIFVVSSDNEAMDHQDNMQMSDTTVELLQNRGDVLQHLNDIRIPPIKEKTLYENSFYTALMGIFVQSVVYTFSEEPDLYGEKWKILVAFKCLLEIQRRAANIDSIGMYFYTKGYTDDAKMQLLIANEAVEEYCFNKILTYTPDVESDTEQLSNAVIMLRNHRFRILNNQSVEVSKSMGMNWIAVVNLYNEQLKSIQDILARDMMKNIDRSRRSAHSIIGITMTVLIFIAIIEPFLLWTNISRTYSLMKVQSGNTAQLRQVTEILRTEKDRSDALIYKLVPEEVANKLKNNIPVVPEIFDSVSVLHADILNFTILSSNHSASEIVNLLNYLFSLIDNLTDKYKAFKAETVGDAYTAVTGLPTCGVGITTSDAVTNIAHLALEMLGQLNTVDHENVNMCEVKLRVGLATGPVSVGMIGMKIPRYCVFGDTVTIARAMEELSFPMRILITKQTRNFLADTGVFETLFRGQFEIGDSIIETHWLVNSSQLPKEYDTSKDNFIQSAATDTTHQTKSVSITSTTENSQ